MSGTMTATLPEGQARADAPYKCADDLAAASAASHALRVAANSTTARAHTSGEYTPGSNSINDSRKRAANPRNPGIQHLSPHGDTAEQPLTN